MTYLLHKDIEFVKKKILSLSAMVEESVLDALNSFDRLDVHLAQEVIRRDQSVDNLEIEVEDDCLKILALHQPVAIDLRFIVAVLKINNDLERIGDLAVNIAEQTIYLGDQDPLAIPGQYYEMARKTEEMLRRSLDVLVNLDVARAREIFISDDEVDRLYAEMFEHVLERITSDAKHREGMLRLLLICRHLERIGDLATNIAEDVIYMVNGEIVRHKGAESS